MSQINIKKTNSDNFTAPGAGRRGIGFDESGNFGYIDEAGDFTIIGSGVVLGVADIEAYDPANTYVAGKFVSYSSTTPGFTDPGIYMTVDFSDLGESPETNPELWEYQGTTINSSTVENPSDDYVYTTKYQEIAGKKKFKGGLVMDSMQQLKQAPAIPAAEILVLPAGGNYVNLTGTTTIKNISNVDSEGNAIQGGTVYRIDINPGTKILHLSSGTGSAKRVRMDAGQDFYCLTGLYLEVLYDAESDWFEVAGTAAGSIGIQSDIIALKINAPAYDLSTGGELVGWTIGELNGCSVDNVGTASVDINANEDGIDIGIGTIYGIEVLSSSGDRIAYFPCNENNAAKLILVDIVNQEEKFINGTKIVVPQSDLFLGQNYGVTFREDADNPGTFTQINYNSDKIKTEVG